MLATAEMVLDDQSLRPTQHAFLEALIDCGSITEASAITGIGRQSHYDWLDVEKQRGIDVSDESPTPGSYAYAFVRAKRIAADRILEKSEQHALSDATDMPATVNRFFHIKRWHPAYRDQVGVNVKGTIFHANVDLGTISDSDRAALLQLAASRAALRLEGGTPPPTDAIDG